MINRAPFCDRIPPLILRPLGQNPAWIPHLFASRFWINCAHPLKGQIAQLQLHSCPAPPKIDKGKKIVKDSGAELQVPQREKGLRGGRGGGGVPINNVRSGPIHLLGTTQPMMRTRVFKCGSALHRRLGWAINSIDLVCEDWKKRLWEREVWAIICGFKGGTTPRALLLRWVSPEPQSLIKQMSLVPVHSKDSGIIYGPWQIRSMSCQVNVLEQDQFRIYL